MLAKRERADLEERITVSPDLLSLIQFAETNGYRIRGHVFYHTGECEPKQDAASALLSEAFTGQYCIGLLLENDAADKKAIIPLDGDAFGRFPTLRGEDEGGPHPDAHYFLWQASLFPCDCELEIPEVGVDILTAGPFRPDYR